MQLSRRQWLVSMIAAAATTIGIAYVALPDDQIDDDLADDREFIWLSRHDQVLLTALLPVLLAGYIAPNIALPSALKQTVLHNVDQAIALQRRGVQAELRQLFDLMEVKFARVALTHSLANWAEMDWQNKHAMLLNWRDHSLDLLQTAYSGVHDLVLAAYFVDSGSWPQIAYEPPPSLRGS